MTYSDNYHWLKLAPHGFTQYQQAPNHFVKRDGKTVIRINTKWQKRDENQTADRGDSSIVYKVVKNKEVKFFNHFANALHFATN